jgi:polyferredoxin
MTRIMSIILDVKNNNLKKLLSKPLYYFFVLLFYTSLVYFLTLKYFIDWYGFKNIYINYGYQKK